MPWTLTVGPYRVRVVRDAPALLDVQATRGDRRIGDFSNRALAITIDPALAPDIAAETLLHEMLHAVIEASGVRAPELDAEGWIAAASPGLLAALRGNPSLVAYLLEPD